MSTLDSAKQLKAKFGNLLSEPVEFRGEITTQLADAEQIAEVCEFARKELGFDFLVDISSLDNHGEDLRWTVVYHLRSLANGRELRLKTAVSEEKSELPTVIGVWRTANWHEREIYDMMGIRFRGHPDLRRILMWEGYPYFPLRKDFPLSGKLSNVPDVAFTKAAPLEGGPFVTEAGGGSATEREPRVRGPESVEMREPLAPAPVKKEAE